MLGRGTTFAFGVSVNKQPVEPTTWSRGKGSIDPQPWRRIMLTTISPITDLKAEDLMSRDVISMPQQMSLRAAATMLNQARISGAPVVDNHGRCIGVLSLRDLVRRLDQGDQAAKQPARSSSCVCADWQVVNLENVPTGQPLHDYGRSHSFSGNSNRRIGSDHVRRPNSPFDHHGLFRSCCRGCVEHRHLGRPGPPLPYT
jgi:hypothetical protein